MSLILILIAACGLVWLMACAIMYVVDIVKAAVKPANPFDKVKATVLKLFTSAWGHDLAISVIFLMLGLLFAGVTGLCIGLLASVIASLVLWIVKLVLKSARKYAFKEDY